VTLLQVAAGTAMPLVVIRAWFTETGITAAGQIAAEVVRKTAAATVTAAVSGDLKKVDPGDAAASVQLGSAEGTDGDAMDIQGFDIRNGYYYTPVPEERETVPGGGIIALKLLSAPANGTYYAGIVFREGVDA
jgi:hypothetical protein